MTKNHLINRLSEQLGESKSSVKRFLEAYTAEIQRTVNAGEDVSLTGIGKLKVIERKARKARNPKTGEGVSLPDRKVVRFKVSRNLAVH